MQCLAVTMGEPAGIGGELTLMAWHRRDAEHTPPFFVIDDPKRLAALAGRLALDVPIAVIDAPSEAAGLWPTALPVLPEPLPGAVTPGTPAAANTAAAHRSIARAVALSQTNAAAAVVTNPINKKASYDAGLTFPGHTEYLADLAGITHTPVMMLAAPQLRVVPATIHIPLAAVPASLTTDLIAHCGRLTAAALVRDFNIAAPRLAFAGLNPHAGEAGAIGAEEHTIIKPAIARLTAEGLDVTGPWPADTLFHAAARQRYDAAICMYHDQALVPVKTLAFDLGVNTTLGLPFIRTSPDHGTAFDIAGTGTADPASLIAALQLAATLAANRAQHDAARRSVNG